MTFKGLQEWEDADATVDFRSVYATVLKTWMTANPSAILGGSYPTLPLFRSGLS